MTEEDTPQQTQTVDARSSAEGSATLTHDAPAANAPPEVSLPADSGATAPDHQSGSFSAAEEAYRAAIARIKIVRDTRFQEALRSADANIRYDAWACKVLSEPPVLAQLAKYFVPQLRNLSIVEIMERMVGISVETRDVPDGTVQEPYLANATDVDKTFQGGSVTYDVKVHIMLSDTDDCAEVIINPEAQNAIRSFPWLRSRMEYSESRLIVSQHGKSFKSPHFEKINPVYSIWIVPNGPLFAQNRVWRSEHDEPRGDIFERVMHAARAAAEEAAKDPSLGPEQITEHVVDAVEQAFDESIDRYSSEESRQFHGHYPHNSLGHGVILFLGKRDKTQNEILRFLDTIFSTTISPDAKGAILDEEYGISPTIEIEEDFIMMGPFSAAVYNQAYRDADQKVEAANRKAEAANRKAEAANLALENMRQEAENAKREAVLTTIRICRKFGQNNAEIVDELTAGHGLSEEQAQVFLQEYERQNSTSAAN